MGHLGVGKGQETEDYLGFGDGFEGHLGVGKGQEAEDYLEFGNGFEGHVYRLPKKCIFKYLYSL